jgi:hypothetical protein
VRTGLNFEGRSGSALVCSNDGDYKSNTSKTEKSLPLLERVVQAEFEVLHPEVHAPGGDRHPGTTCL